MSILIFIFSFVLSLLIKFRIKYSSFCHRAAGKKLLSLIALSLNLDDDFFEKIGALNKPATILRLLHYPGLLALICFHGPS